MAQTDSKEEYTEWSGPDKATEFGKGGLIKIAVVLGTAVAICTASLSVLFGKL